MLEGEEEGSRPTNRGAVVDSGLLEEKEDDEDISVAAADDVSSVS